MLHARIALVVVGVLVPYIARLPGTLTHGASWFTAYWSSGVGGFMFMQSFNAVAWGSVFLLSFVVRRRIALLFPAVCGFGFVAHAHATLDLGADPQNAVALVFIPLYAFPVIIVASLASIAIFGRGDAK